MSDKWDTVNTISDMLEDGDIYSDVLEGDPDEALANATNMSPKSIMLRQAADGAASRRDDRVYARLAALRARRRARVDAAVLARRERLAAKQEGRQPELDPEWPTPFAHKVYLGDRGMIDAGLMDGIWEVVGAVRYYTAERGVLQEHNDAEYQRMSCMVTVDPTGESVRMKRWRLAGGCA